MILIRQNKLFTAMTIAMLVCGCNKVESSSNRGGGEGGLSDAADDTDDTSDTTDAGDANDASDVDDTDKDDKPGPVTKDSKKPTVTITSVTDKTVRRGEKLPISIAADGTGSNIATVSWAYAADGSNFGPETVVAGAKTSFDVFVPDATVSSPAAKFRVTVTDGGGNTASATTTAMLTLSRAAGFGFEYEPVLFHADGPASTARFANMNGSATDGTYLYIITSSNIRRVRLSDGLTETISGANSRAPKTVDGTGRSASWNGGRAGTVLNKKLYVTDYNDHVIRRVDVDEASPNFGLTETISGVLGVSGSTDTAPGIDAKFNNPFGITNDGTYLYIGDISNQTIRRLNPANGTVSTVAGLAGSSGSLNGPTGASRLTTPRTLTYDATTKLIYFIESSYYRIRTLDPATGIVGSFAGSNKSGDIDGAGSGARFSYPADLTSDGNFLYVADVYAHTVRKIDLATAIVSPLAGKSGINGFADAVGAAARLNYPHSLVWANGALYVGDYFNGLMRKVDTGTGAVTTFAGAPLGSTPRLSPVNSTMDAGVGGMSIARSIVTDNGDDFYLTTYGQVIRHVKLSANTITTVAGSSNAAGGTDDTGADARFDMPRGIVKIGGTLYVADQYGSTIRAIDLATGTVSTIAGAYGEAAITDNAVGTDARFSEPVGLATDGAYLYVSDSRRIRRVDLIPPHAVTTIAGGTAGYLDHATGTSAQLGGIWGLAVSGTNLYFNDFTNHAIRMVDLASGNAVSTLAGAPPPTGAPGYIDDVDPNTSRFYQPTEMSISGGKLYIIENLNKAVRSYDLATHEVRTVAGPGTSTPAFVDATGDLARVHLYSMTVHGGKIYGQNDALTLVAIDAASGQSQTLGPVSTSHRSLGGSIVSNNDGTLRDASINNSLQCITTDGTHLFASTVLGEIVKMDADGTNRQILAGTAGETGYADGVGAAARFGRVIGCAVHGDWLYLADAYNAVIRRLSLTTKVVETVAGVAGKLGHVDAVGAAARFDRLGRLTVDGDNLFVSETDTNLIKKVSLATADFGTVTTIAGQSGVSGSADGVGLAATFDTPSGMVVLNGNLYICDQDNSTVREMNLTTGAVTTLVGVAGEPGVASGGAAARLDSPIGIVTDGQDLFVLDYSAFVIRKINMATKVTSIFAGVPYSMTGNPDPKIGDAPLSARGTFVFIPGVGFVIVSSNHTPERLY